MSQPTLKGPWSDFKQIHNHEVSYLCLFFLHLRVLHLLICSPDAYNGYGQARQQPRARLSPGLSPDSSTGSIDFCSPQYTTTEGWNGKQIQDSNLHILIRRRIYYGVKKILIRITQFC